MNEKSWLVLRIVACLYVVYLGIELVVKIMTDKPGNMVFLMAAGIFFMVVGTVIVVISVKDLRKLNKRLAEEAEQTEDAEREMEVEDGDTESNYLETDTEEVEADTDVHREVSLDIAEENEDIEKDEK